MADEMDENLSSNDETRVRLPGNEGRYRKQRIFHGNGYSKSSTPKLSSKVVNNKETVSSATITRSESNIHNILPKEPERTRGI